MLTSCLCGDPLSPTNRLRPLNKGLMHGSFDRIGSRARRHVERLCQERGGDEGCVAEQQEWAVGSSECLVAGRESEYEYEE